VADSGRGHWWTTLPGVLTASAALVTAFTGLVLGLGQLGLLGSDDGPAAGAGTQTSAPVAGGTAAAASSPPSAPVSSAPSSAASTAPAAPELAAATTTLPLDQPIRISEDVSYELLEAEVRPDADGQVALVLTVRMTKHTGGDAGFWDDSFRVAVGPDVYPASGGLNELVAGRATSRGEVLVELPDDTRRAELVLGYYGDRRTVPFEVVPAT
jgi:hypothetical protein